MVVKEYRSNIYGDQFITNDTEIMTPLISLVFIWLWVSNNNGSNIDLMTIPITIYLNWEKLSGDNDEDE